MILQDFPYTQSDHSVTQELFLCGLFWKLSKNFGFHRNQCKKEVIYGSAAPGLCTLFRNQVHLFTEYAQFFHFMLLSLSKIVSNGVQKLKGKHAFRKIEIVHVCQFVSCVAQKRNHMDVINSSRILTVLPNICSQKSDIARLLVIGILKT